MRPKRSYGFLRLLAGLLLVLAGTSVSSAQDSLVTITVDAASPHKVQIQGRFARPRPFEKERSLAFMTDYAGVNGLALRLSDLRLKDVNGRTLAVRKAAEGEYSADAPITSWSYRADLTPIQRTNAATHLSWLGPDGGVLMIDDILPQGNGRAALVRLVVPSGWSIMTAAGQTTDGGYAVDDIEKITFAVGPRWRDVYFGRNLAKQDVYFNGSWSFDDREAVDLVTEISSHYSRLFGKRPPGGLFLAIHKFPFQTNFGEWEADTRGSSITIASSDMPFKSQSLQRLHEQLRHEIFHLWIPNGLKLTGRYDWFYEGFAMYQSLKLGVGVGRIRFDDMLDTLSRAYTIDATSPRRVSLIEASSSRFAGNDLSVYARGMVVAFLCDIALLKETKGKASTDDLVRDVYSRYSTGPSRDGNEAITALLKERQYLSTIADRYIAGAEAIDWAAYLVPAGLEARQAGRQTTLSVVAKPSGRQKDMLDKLGYNSWRKLAGSK